MNTIDIKIERNALVILNDALKRKRFRYIGPGLCSLSKEHAYFISSSIGNTINSLTIKDENKKEVLSGLSLDFLKYFYELK